MIKWQQFSDPDIKINFSYPDPSPGGFNIKRQFKKTALLKRIHLSSPESGELYFELSCYPDGLDPKLGRQQLVDENRQRFEGFKATALVESAAASVPAQKFAFSWREASRHVFFFDIDSVAYRIIFNPESELNHQVFSTVKLSL